MKTNSTETYTTPECVEINVGFEGILCASNTSNRSIADVFDEMENPYFV